MTEELFNEIATWQRQTFPNGTALSCLSHLSEEVKELEISLNRYDFENAMEEIADCLFLIYGTADRMGLTYEIIQAVVLAKFEKNKTRKWGNPDSNGVVKHIE